MTGPGHESGQPAEDRPGDLLAVFLCVGELFVDVVLCSLER